jgi:hypothetical protein
MPLTHLNKKQYNIQNNRNSLFYAVRVECLSGPCQFIEPKQQLFGARKLLGIFSQRKQKIINRYPATRRRSRRRIMTLHLHLHQTVVAYEVGDELEHEIFHDFNAVGAWTWRVTEPVHH